MQILSKKHKRKIKFFLKIIYFTLGALTILFVAFALFSMKKPLYISPFSLSGDSSYKITSSSVEKNIELLLKSRSIAYSSLSLEQQKYTITLKEGEKVFLDANKPLDTQISSLQLLLSRLTIEGKHFETLDFRYNKPIIVLKQ